MPKPTVHLFLCLFLTTVLACGGESGDNSADLSENEEGSDTINTEKLIGTPFEGLETGDDLPWSTFFCGSYRTETVDQFPISIFAAFFTADQEAVIQEGIDIANEAMGQEVYVLTDEWGDDLRVIYRVVEITDPVEGDYTEAGGVTVQLYYDFNGRSYADVSTADWVIEIRGPILDKWVVAHELGHATGIKEHMKIDYENDALVDLEKNSLMEMVTSAATTALTDYNFMMRKQTELMQSHFGEKGILEVEHCRE